MKTDIDKVRGALEPCSFCGNTVIRVINDNTEDAVAFCGQCGCEFNAYLRNTRVIPPGKVLVDDVEVITINPSIIIEPDCEKCWQELEELKRSIDKIECNAEVIELLDNHITYLQRREEQ